MEKERLFKFMQRCNRMWSTPDLHSFKANIKNGYVWVECRGYETYVESHTYDADGNEQITRFVGTTVAATNRLEMLGIEFDSIDM